MPWPSKDNEKDKTKQRKQSNQFFFWTKKNIPPLLLMSRFDLLANCKKIHFFLPLCTMSLKSYSWWCVEKEQSWIDRFVHFWSFWSFWRLDHLISLIPLINIFILNNFWRRSNFTNSKNGLVSLTNKSPRFAWGASQATSPNGTPATLRVLDQLIHDLLAQ